MDGEGYLWNCRYGGGCVVRVAPDGGIDRVIDIPAGNVTTCTFGGPELTTLYVTTAAADRAPTTGWQAACSLSKPASAAWQRIRSASASRS